MVNGKTRLSFLAHGCHAMLNALHHQERRPSADPCKPVITLHRGPQAAPAHCPVCRSPREAVRHGTTTYACGAALGPHSLNVCHQPSEETLLQALWGWCRRQELYKAASCARKRVVPRLEKPRPIYGLALQPTATTTAPERCPLCDAEKVVGGPFLRSFACGCSLHCREGRWQGYEPCPEAQLDDLLQALSQQGSSAWFADALQTVRTGAAYDLWM